LIGVTPLFLQSPHCWHTARASEVIACWG
jgi:hypothetical protein